MKASASIELIVLIILVLGIIAFFSQSMFPNLWKQNESLEDAMSVSEVSRAILNTLEVLRYSPVGTESNVYIHLPRFTSISCSKGGNLLRLRAWNYDKNVSLPFACENDFWIQGPFRGYITIRRTGTTEVSIG